MRIVLIALLVAVGAALGYVYYWNKKLEPITKKSAARIVPLYFEPIPVTWPVRHLDLGYARFDVPSTLSNALVRAGNGSVLKFEPLTDEPSQGIGFIMSPVSESGVDTDQLLKGFEPLTDRKYDSVFELKKHALNTQPPSIWTAFTPGGRKRVVRDLCLLTMKGSIAGDGKVRVAESERIGLIITEHGSTIFFELYDKKNRHVQIMGFDRVFSGVKLEEVISSIFYIYNSTVTDFSEDSLRRALEKAGYSAKSQARVDS